MIRLDEALRRIFEAVPHLGSETVPLASAHGRVLAAPLTAGHSQPPFDSSAMDGYAVRHDDVTPGRPLRLAGTAQAGARFIGMMGRGQCVRIFTGAPIPIGADAVVMQEQATADGRDILFDAAPPAGHNIRRRGMDFLAGSELLSAGTTMTPVSLSLAAAANRTELTVVRRPRLALLATGDELVPPGDVPGPDQIVASNSSGLTPLFAPYCRSILDLGIARDDPQALEAALLGALDDGTDIVVTTGGASVGERDFVQDVLVDLGVDLDFWKIAMRPGKPLMFGTRGRTMFFGLPGNPVSAMVTAMVVVVPALRAMTGVADPVGWRLRLPLAAQLPANGGRRHFLRARLEQTAEGGLLVRPVGQTDSSHLTSLATADGLIVQLENDPGQDAGATVEFLPFSGL